MNETWVVLRSESDSAQDDKHPSGWIDSIKGFRVNPDIGEHGGILIDAAAVDAYMEEYAFDPEKADPKITIRDYVKKGPPTCEALAKWLAGQRPNGWYAMPLRGIVPNVPDAAPVMERQSVPAARPTDGSRAADSADEETLDTLIAQIQANGGPSLSRKATLGMKKAYIREHGG